MSTYSTTAAQADLDLFADEILLDPYPTYRTLREAAGVVYLPTNDVYALTRYDVIRGALADWESFSSSSIGFNPMVNEALQGTSLASDPPVHTQLRATLNRNLTPRALRGLKDTIDAKADALVADLVSKGSFDAIDSLARAFPLEVVADLIGFTGEVRDNMLRWGQAAMQVIGPMNQRTAESFPIAGELYAWCSQVTASDLSPDSVGRGIFDAEARGDIPPNTAGHIIHQYLGAGVDTTIAAIGNIIALFAAHPDQLELVRKDRELLPAAFSEVLRFWAPVHAWGRRVTKATPSTISRSATDLTGAPGKAWRASRRTPSSTRWRDGWSAWLSARRGECPATSPGASRSSPSWRWCPDEDRPGPATMRGPRPVRRGRTPPAAPRRRG